jgi:hypothetical protein
LSSRGLEAAAGHPCRYIRIRLCLVETVPLRDQCRKRVVALHVGQLRFIELGPLDMNVLRNT